MPFPWPVGVRIGVCVLSVAGALSFISTVILLGLIGASTLKGRSDANGFARSHFAGYIFSLLICDAIDGVASMLNFGVVVKGTITKDALCVMRAVLKHVGLLGAALWLLVIAIHTFIVLFYCVHPPRWVFIATFSGIWSLILIIMTIGPFRRLAKKGPPFYGQVTYWCWISEDYPIDRYTLQYGWQFLSAIVSLILYTLLFFRLRGNIRVKGWRFYFQRRIHPTTNIETSVITHPKDRLSSDTPDQDNSTLVPQFQRIARKVMLYPIAYICLMAPSAAVIIISLSGIKVPKGVTLFTMTLVWLNGLADVILFILTRPAVLADPTFLPRPLRSLVGRLSDNRGSARQPNLHDLSIQEVTSPPMGHTGGMNMRVGAERAWEDEGGLHVAPSQGRYDPMAPRVHSTPLTHHHFNSLSVTACSSNFPDRRDVSFEDEGGGTYGIHTSRRWGSETPWVQEEDRYIHYPQLQPLHHPFMRVSPTVFDRSDLQTNEDGPTIQHPYNTHPMIR